MLKDRDFIIFGDDWGRYPSTIQYIGKEIRKSNRIIWIGSLGLRKPVLSIKDFTRAFEKLKKIKFNKDSIPAPQIVSEVHPRIIPLHDYSFVRQLNNKSLINAISGRMSQLGFRDPIILTASPVIGDIIGELGESSSHYLCLDDWAEFEGAFKSIVHLEKDLLKKVDSCFAISELLVKNRKPLNGEAFYLPQGVNFDHFNREKKIPDSLNNLKSPVIGFFGLIANYIDINLIRDCALRYPQYTFLIIGKSTVDLSELLKQKNVIYTGPVEYAVLPDYAAAFNVGLIPFQLNELTIAANPLKFIEYLALGIPVVSTGLPEVKKFGDLVYTAANNEQFIDSIELALKENTEEKALLRKSVAERYSWASVAEELCSKIEQIDMKKR